MKQSQVLEPVRQILPTITAEQIKQAEGIFAASWLISRRLLPLCLQRIKIPKTIGASGGRSNGQIGFSMMIIYRCCGGHLEFANGKNELLEAREAPFGKGQVKGRRNLIPTSVAYGLA